MKIKLMVGNCLEKLKLFKDESVDVVVSSPPYNLGIKYDVYKDDSNRYEYIEFLINVIKELKRVLKPEGSVFINIGGSSVDPLLPFQLANLVHYQGLKLQNSIIWVKSISINGVTKGHFKPIGGQRFLNHCHENILHFTKSGKVKLDRLSPGNGVAFQDKSNIKRRGHKQDLRCSGNVWYIKYETKNKKADTFKHPASFPTELPKRCLTLHGNVKKLTVLDPFCGAGSSGIAAAILGVKKFIGIDISKKYIKITRQRLKSNERFSQYDE